MDIEEIKGKPLTKEEKLVLINGIVGLIGNEPKEVVYKEDYDELQARIDKAIEYIKEHYPTSTINYQEDRSILLNILKGSDKE